MALASGTRLGPYEILSALGAGGMGEVYCARDAKLGRDIAIKVLPDTLAHDPDRLARFEREAQTLGALNHPNIAHIHGFEDSTGVPALVMELVEGPTLADRIAKGPIPFDEALPIAKQIAEALEAAHEQGIIHRDLKPANIKVRFDGTVKLLDFGLAKAFDPVAGASASGSATMSPTLSVHATLAGVVLGTAAYMSPEQARGKPVDKGADIWAFGCVLFEMLAGAHVFGGEDISSTLARVIEREPDWSTLPPGTSPNIRRLLHRCLQKDPKRRLRDAGSAILDLDDAYLPGELETVDTIATPAPRTWRLVTTNISLLVAGLAVGASGMWTVAHWSSLQAQVVRFSIPLEQGVVYTGLTRQLIAVSPDGNRLAYVANRRIYLRAFNQSSAAAIPSTEVPSSPFFSPDGQWLAFWTTEGGGVLKKVPVSGGAPVTLCHANSPTGASWERNDRILIGQGPAGIWEVPANGGPPTTLIEAKNGELAHGPQRLPESRSTGQTTCTTRSGRGTGHA
jgi:eukaryotic-like serine/threonine-protein kinase